MRLANQTLKYLSISVLVVIALWSTVFYLFMLEVIHDNIDEELETKNGSLSRNFLAIPP